MPVHIYCKGIGGKKRSIDFDIEIFQYFLKLPKIKYFKIKREQLRILAFLTFLYISNLSKQNLIYLHVKLLVEIKLPGSSAKWNC